jgi:hypothetical protein
MHTAIQLPFPPRRRSTGIALTVAVHAALLLGWQVAHMAAPAGFEPEPAAMQWLRLPAPVVAVPAAPATPPKPVARPVRQAPAAPLAPAPAAPVAAAPAAPSAAIAPAATAGASPVAEAGVLQRALRAAGGIDRALRKENNPYIVAPLDSPQIRMRRGMQAAADLAPGKWYEAPKVEELVNNTGDGARRTRVITGGGSYCVTERATNTSIDMIEKHGKLRLTNCPEHETPASAQQWRTARD